MKFKISAISYHLPKFSEKLEALKNDNPDWDISKIFEKTGIVKRHISAVNETAADLAFEAANKMISEYAIDKSQIDLLILVTQSPDYILPPTACILQNKLGLSTKSMAFDVNLGCSGFIYALAVAGGLIESGVVRKGIILCADTYTKYIAKNDRTCRPIFSDGASAVLVEKNTEESIGPFEFGTDGSGHDRLIIKNSGARKSDELSKPILEMQGSSVFLFTMNVVPAAIKKLLERSSLKMEDIDLVIFHQASKIIIDNLAKNLSLDENKIFTNYENLGNTVSATIPIALKDAASKGRLKSGDKVMLVGFGVGLSWGATIINWSI